MCFSILAAINLNWIFMSSCWWHDYDTLDTLDTPDMDFYSFYVGSETINTLKIERKNFKKMKRFLNRSINRIGVHRLITQEMVKSMKLLFDEIASNDLYVVIPGRDQGERVSSVSMVCFLYFMTLFFNSW